MVPEVEDGEWKSGEDAYLEQVEWERKGLDMCDVILFWIPREMEKMPGLTTNVEFGLYVSSGKVVLGAPDWAKSVKYLEHALRAATGEPDDRRKTLETTVQACRTKLNKLLPGVFNDTVEVGNQWLSVRHGGERCVPLHIWKLDSFQSWYRAQVMAGNRLDDAKLLWSFTIPKIGFVFSWVLHVDVWIASEQRSKVNEFVLARSDISTVCLYRWPTPPSDGLASLIDVEVVLIREFRSPARTQDGMVHELPGGSSFPEKALRDLTFRDAARPPSHPHPVNRDLIPPEQTMVVRAQEDDVVHYVGASFGSVNDVAHVAGVLGPASQSTLGAEVESSDISERAWAGILPVRGTSSKPTLPEPHPAAGIRAAGGIRTHRPVEGEHFPTDHTGERCDAGSAVRRFNSLVKSTTLSPAEDGGANLPCGTRDGVSAVSAGLRDHGFISGARMGSSTHPVSDDYRQVASDEVHEETGLIISASRFRRVGSRQLVSTLSAHHAHLFAAELTAAEMAQAKSLAANQTVNGVEEDSERTYVEVMSLRDILGSNNVDWSTVGMIMQALDS